MERNETLKVIIDLLNSCREVNFYISCNTPDVLQNLYTLSTVNASRGKLSENMVKGWDYLEMFSMITLLRIDVVDGTKGGWVPLS